MSTDAETHKMRSLYLTATVGAHLFQSVRIESLSVPGDDRDHEFTHPLRPIHVTNPAVSGSADDGGDSVQLSRSVLDLPWVADGKTEDEKIPLGFLAELVEFNPEAADRIAAMPFLQTFGPADIKDLWSLTYPAEYDDEEETTVLVAVQGHPHLADGGGIDNQEAKVVTVLSEEISLL